MWEQFKRRIKQLMANEEPENIDELHQQHDEHEQDRQSSVHTRVSYQYPKEKSFKFPVIPDVSEADRNQMPAYERRSAKTNNRAGNEQLKKEQTQKDKNQFNQQPPYQKQNKQPFKPTEVPSPIYGFRQSKRKEQEQEHGIPTYLRKDRGTPVPDEEIVRQALQPAVTNEYSDQEDSPFQHEPEHMEESAASQTEDDFHFYETQKTDFGTNGSTLTEDHPMEEGEMEEPESVLPKPEEAQENSEEELPDSQENNQYAEMKPTEDGELQSEPASRRQERSRSRSPFNVIMTPRDKRSQLQRREQPASKKSTIPPAHLLNDPISKSKDDREWVDEQIELLEMTLAHFNVKAKVVNAMSGPSVTRFEVQPELGVKVSKIKNLSDDIKLNMAARDIRMEAPIPGKNAIGIEVPNPVSQAVGLQEIFAAGQFMHAESPLSVALGLDIAGKPIVTNLQKMPHGLIAGATGSGKSVCINTILISLLYKASHKDVRFLLIDPKMVELAPYNGLPHLVSPVITDVKAATSALKWAVGEMEERYEKFVKEGVRDVERYNQKMKQQQRADEHLPYLVIVIDELADLMMVSPQDVEDSICRIAQKARACGIHLLLATQRPSVDVITGLIKANIPTRIAFSVSSQVDSRTIIDTNGAEKLLGKGDMLFMENGSGQSIRIQGAFVSDDEIERVTNHVKKIAPPQYLFEQEQLLSQATIEEEEDQLYAEAVEFVLHQNGASASLLQRRFKIGYNRAARLIDLMEAKGIISEQKGSKPRDILVSSSQLAD
ncbi:DNA translocase FtsK [Sediminibacillus albus]|uniref:DNA segregation ATPase FtsK/SpoIIIE, S-DNA-T family n=1 Tax=Sediminibacillus albus TaxID=407036 RepID=A0A1G9BZ21_9BACI|nr:DNA translocase FtsK [Sediminibacillus albus]SDK44185.1 DNA segregation ATPase FtsK/SpoIIIE, S-DNA-T family [Sediminibacillus albus]